MGVCDICNAPGMGTLISAEQMREAVFKNGFNPFKLGLTPDLSRAFGTGAGASYNNWKNTIVAQDTSDWNICSKCITKLKPYLKGAPKPTGVKKATVSQHPVVSALAGAKAQEKYKPGKQPDVTPKRKIKSKIISILKICPFCGEKILPAAIKCKHCGEWLGEKPHLEGNTSGQGNLAVVPEEIKKWNWGAFLLSLIWGIGNNVWIALLCLIPYVGFIMIFVLGAKGSEWAWQKKRWDSIEHFKNVQKKWAMAGVGLLIFGIVMLIILSAITASLR